MSDFWPVIVCLILATASYILLRPSPFSLADLPGPPSPSIFFGNFLELINAETGALEIEWFSEYGPVIVYRGIFGKIKLSVTDPKALNHILVQHSYDYPKPDEMRSDLMRLLGPGVLWAEGEEHKRQRRLLNPTFSAAQLRGIAPMVHSIAQKLSARWTEKIVEDKRRKNDETILDVMPWLNRATLDIIGEAGFGYRFDVLDNPNDSELAKALSVFTSTKGMFEGASKLKVLVISALRHFPTILKLLPMKRIAVTAQCLKTMERETSKLLARAKNSHETQENRKDLLSLLVRANTSQSPEGDRMSDQEVMGHMTTFLFAGHETTATAMTWFLWLLAKHPHVQAKLRAELADAMNSCQRLPDDEEGMPIGLEKLTALPFLDAFCREGFRFLTPVPSTARVATHDDKIPLSKPVRTQAGMLVDHLTVSAGQQIIIPIHPFHYSEDIFGPDAHLYKPERWMKDHVPKSGTGHWAGLMTFLAGPKACVGYRFALIELKILLMVLVTQFKFEERDVGGGPEFQRYTTIVMRPKIKGDVGGPSMPLRISLL